MSAMLGMTGCIVKALTSKRVMHPREAAWGRRRQPTVVLSSRMAYIGSNTSQCTQRTFASFEHLHLDLDLMIALGMPACSETQGEIVREVKRREGSGLEGPILDVPLLEMARGQPIARADMGVHALTTAVCRIPICNGGLLRLKTP